MKLDTMLALALLAGTASAAPADDYAMQWPLTLADRDAGAHAVVLDDEVYAQARSQALRDLDVLNAHGAAVPAQLMRTGGGGRAEAPRVPVRWFVLPRADDGRGGWSMAVERAADGSLLRVQAGSSRAHAGDGPAAWLVDASGLEAGIEALHLQWQESDGGIDRAYRIEASDDLRDWRALQSPAQLIDLSRDGERLQRRRVPVASSARYLRLLPGQGQGSPRLQAIQAELSAPDQRAPLQWRELAGTPVDERGVRALIFSLDGRYPVEAADLQYDGGGTAQWRLYSREHAEAPWVLRAGPWVAYTIGSGEGAIRSAPEPLTGIGRDREWKLVGAEGAGPAPRLRLGWRSETLVFIAQGAPPYRLVAGSARAQRGDAPVAQSLEAIRGVQGPDWRPGAATLGDMQPLAGEAALVPAAAARDWRAWLLWTLLIGGALLVAGFAASLLRKPHG
ncbi:DUF3999 domain-containing protein [Luteimonas sp. SDU101]|uniref:DUF3999 domain-containing protein n=1 Tax=Luteimonas sp. SDU101 TaxID=3422593 RepID=UPI003EBA7CD2